MDQNRIIQQKIESTLDSLDGITKAGPGPFFYTRLQARLHSGSISRWDKVVSIVGSPSVALAMIIFVIFINSAAILVQERQDNPLSEQTNEPTVSEEYAIASNSYADYVNQDPE